MYKEAIKYIINKESFTPIAKWDVDAYRVGYGSETKTFPDGSFRRVVQGDTSTIADADRDIIRILSTVHVPILEKAIGKKEFYKLPVNARVALISLVYNYGRIKQPIADAAKTGDLKKLAQALINNTWYDNQSKPLSVQNALRERRKKEAELILSSYKANMNKYYLAIGAITVVSLATLFILKQTGKIK